MSGTILTYLTEYGEKSFEELAFHDVDALILCQFAYLKFDGLVPDVDQSLPPASIGDVAAHPNVDALFADERYEKVNRELFQRMKESRRFGNLRIGAYVNLIEKAWEMQFSAVTFYLEGGITFLAFRGTDESIVGWKEDCNMAFLSPIPSQHGALKYLNRMADAAEGKLILGGHSKGGNLAIYAAMNCSREIQARIQKIYNMDGPGFRPEVLKESAYDEIEDRIVKILPHSSLIGMLFEQDEKYKVVESKSVGPFQHNPFYWIVKEGQFVFVRDVKAGQKFMDGAINEWILSLSEDKIRLVINTLFSVLEATEADDLVKMSEDKKKSILGMVAAMKGLDEDVRKGTLNVVRSLLEIAGSHALSSIDQKVKKLGKKFSG